ncbi:hypothetical protein Q4530_08265 [Colwellia sp. 1_MG-2023]|nr:MULTISPECIES: hypothetical protein [unclassified Colwellia]MBU2924284.1 hypothetical protein [Colwellia sp. C2M11]MDO6652993.1 hypothetical protein [Colwellia sp. 3_MG-2023]MDO6665475.1 hypothetical protein [Colwellia sp. 2_MG-2023]MDO6689766.1 hypothetical protein [Colwellia sp. 1_MG-2023]
MLNDIRNTQQYYPTTLSVITENHGFDRCTAQEKVAAKGYPSVMQVVG